MGSWLLRRLGRTLWGKLCGCKFKVSRLTQESGGHDSEIAQLTELCCRVIDLQMEGSSGSPGPSAGQLFQRGLKCIES